MQELKRYLLCAIGLHDVVLDEWASGPAVDGEVAIARWVEATSVVDRPEGR